MLRIRTVGTTSNRNGIGARVEVSTADGIQWRHVRTGSSYLSQSELPLTFGLGESSSASVRGVWPSGQTDTVDNVSADQVVVITEGDGITETAPIVTGR